MHGFLALLGLLGLLAPRAHAHYPLVDAASGGAGVFDTLANAVEVADVNRSQFTNRVSVCDAPYLWFKFEAPKGFETLMVGGTVPVIERFWNVRVAAAVIGPGLGAADVEKLPAAVAAQVPQGMGAVAVPGVADVSKCDWMEDPLSTGELHGGVSPYISSTGGADAPFTAYPDWPAPRCFYHEEWQGSDMWMVQDKLVPLSTHGTHFIVFWVPSDQHLGEPTAEAKFGIVFGDVGQSEEFSGEAAKAGECSLPPQDFYENACAENPYYASWKAEHPIAYNNADCTPFYGVPIPNSFECAVSDVARAPHCNSLCHNDGRCLPADEVSCPGQCGETCAYAACPGEQGPLGPACPAACTPLAAGGRRSRELLFASTYCAAGSYATSTGCAECPPECLGDFDHDHHEDHEDPEPPAPCPVPGCPSAESYCIATGIVGCISM